MRLFSRSRKLVQRLRTLTEAEAYARCHGDREEYLVRVVQMEARRPRYQTAISGEDLRRSFERRLDAREPQAD